MLISVQVTAQNISGTILSDEGKPLYDINVGLDGTHYYTQTNQKGEFTLKNVSQGVYTLVATATSYSTVKQNIVIDNDNIVLNLKLIKDTTELQEVIITSFRNLPKDEASFYAAKLPLKNIENPQVINLVSNQIISEQAVLDFNSALKNVPGITKGWASMNGFYSSRGFSTRNYIRNGVAAFATADLDVANMEQIQVVKGPTGTLFGSPLVSFGGMINRITKKSFDSTRVEVGYQGGSYDLNRFTIDLNTPLVKDKTVLFRLNASHHYSGSFQDAGFIKSVFIAPSLFYRVNERLSFSLDAEIYSSEATSHLQIVPMGSGQDGKGNSNPSSLPIDYKRSYSNNNMTIKYPTQSFYGQIKYKMSDKWTSETNLVRTKSENTGNYLTFHLLKGDSLMVRNVLQFPTAVYSVTQIQQNFTGDFKIGRMRNRLLLGIDYYQNSSNSSSNALGGRGGRPSFDTLNIKGNMPNYSMLTPHLIDEKLEGFPADYVTMDLITFAAYASDVVNITDNLSAMLSLRIDRSINKGTTNVATNVTNGSFNQTAVSPKFGLVYQVIKNRVSLFGNYMNGFQNVAPVTQPDGSISTFKPQYANQLELGIKTELVGGLISTTISYYDIQVQNTLRTDVDRPTFQVQEGTQFSKGFEIDLFSRPVAGLLVNAGFAYNDSKLTSGNAAVNGLRTANSGPEKTVNFYASYSFPKTSLKGFGIGFGGNYSDENLIINNKTAGQFYLDSYTILNAGVFYNKERYRFGVNIDNLNNHQYYTGGYGTFTPGMLRRCIVSLNVRF